MCIPRISSKKLVIMRRSLCRVGRFAIVSLVLHIVAVELYHGIDCQESKKTKIDFSKVHKFVKPIFEKFKIHYGPGSKIVSTSRKFGSNVVKSLTSNALEFLETFDKDNVFEETLKETDNLFAGFLDNFFKNSKEDEADDQESEDDQENGHDQENKDDQADEEPEGDTGEHEASDSEKHLSAEQNHKNALEEDQSSAFEAEHIQSEDLLPEDGKEEVKCNSDHTKDDMERNLEDCKGNKSPILGKSKHEDKTKKLEEDQTSVEEKSKNDLSEVTGSSQKVSKGLLHESGKNEHSNQSESKHELGGEKRTDQSSEKSKVLFKDVENEHVRPAGESYPNKKTKYNKKLNGSDEKPNSTNGPSGSKQRGPITLSLLRDIDVKFLTPVKVSNPKSLLRRKPSKFRKCMYPKKPQPPSQGLKSQPSQQVNEPQDPQPSLHPPKQDEPKLTHHLQKSNPPILIKSSKKEEKHHTDDKENQIEDCGFDCEPIT